MNIALFEPNKIPQYIQSVNGAEYMLDPQALEGFVQPKDNTILINPNIAAVINVPIKHWKKVGSTIVEMSAAEKQAIADAELAQRKATADDYRVDMKIALTALVKVINLRLSNGQKITKQEVIDALKAEIV